MDNVYVAIGYGLANSILIVGDGGNIIIDVNESDILAAEIRERFEEISNQPIEAIFYTHSHVDHWRGAASFVDDGTEVYAHETFKKGFYDQNNLLKPILTERGMKQFGFFLPKELQRGHGLGFTLDFDFKQPPVIYPTVLLKGKKNILTIAGITLEIIHSPGETDDQIIIYYQDKEVVFSGDNYYMRFPNLYTIRGTTHRDVKGWIDSIDHMKSFSPSFLFPSHTKPIIGVDKIQSALNTYRDAIQFIHDQTIRLMNQGLYPDEIVEMISLPKHIADSPYLYEFYGTVRWSVKSIFNGYLGWFSGNPSELDPLSRKEKAIRISRLAGGNDKLLDQLKVAVENNDMQWALELSDHLIALDYFIDEVKDLRIDALIYEGSRSSNPNKRNYFLSSALELNGSILDTPLTDRTSEELLQNISIDTLFDVLSSRYNPINHTDDNFKVCFNFSSSKSKSITLRNQVAVVSDDIVQNCNIKILTEELEFKKILVGISNPVSLIASGSMGVDGSTTEFLQFLAKFR